MAKRSREKAAMRIRTVCVSGPVAVLLVFLVGFLLQCGDVESNPGPRGQPKQSTLTGSPMQTPCRKDSASDVNKDGADVVKMLAALDKKIEGINSLLQEQAGRFQTEIENVVKENKVLKDKVDRLESKIDDLEGRSRRKNVVFHGIPNQKGVSETWQDCEDAVKSVLREDMDIQGDIEIDRAHRLKGSKNPQPIIVAFSKAKDRELVLAGRRKLREKKSGIFVNEDFTTRVREVRRKLLPFLKEAKDAGKRASLRFDSLHIDGKAYVYDGASGRPVQRQSRE